jgi:VanZ family protein
LSLGVFAACLWPYNFVETNRISLLPGGKGMRFEAPAVPDKSNPGGILFTPGGLICRMNPGCEQGAVSIAIRLKAATETSGCIKRIFDLRGADGSEAFYLGQWKSSLIVRSFASRPPGGKPYEEIGAAGALTAGKESLVAVSSNNEGTAIYLDGRLAKQFPGVRLLRAGETPAGYRLHLGNSPDISCPWAGEIYELAIYGRVLVPGGAIENGGIEVFCNDSAAEKALACYRFEGIDAERIVDLSGNRNDLIAARRLYFEKPVLHLTHLSEFNNRDFWLNVVGFIPMGFIYFFRQFKFCKKSFWPSAAQGVLIGSVLSLAVELAQAWLPTRDSSMADLIANAAGALTGAAGGLLWVRCRRRLRTLP